MIKSFEPIVNKNCKVLILGTMPGIQSLEKHEYYGNERNAFWKIIFCLLQQKISGNYEQKKQLLLQHKIALWDVLKACNREGSLDSCIEEPISNDFANFFKQYPNIKAVYFNGEPAEKFYKRLISKKDSDLFYHRLPSTSPSNAVKFEEKLQSWKPILIMLRGLKYCDIQSIEAYLGGFLGISYEVKINIVSLSGFYITKNCENNLIKQKDLVFSEKSLILFIHQLYENKVFSWNESYKSDVENVDGTYCKLKIISRDTTYNFSGSNEYPRQWKSFCKSMQDLIKEPFGCGSRFE